MFPASQLEKALHQPQSGNRGLIALQRCGFWWHRMEFTTDISDLML
jgi:hypothetical protein